MAGPVWPLRWRRLVMWLLLHFNRMMQVLKRAADRPIGYVDSAVMLNAKLKPGVTLLHVVAMTRALGAAAVAEGRAARDLSLDRWRRQSHVTCEFHGGKLGSGSWCAQRRTTRPRRTSAARPRKIAGFAAILRPHTLHKEGHHEPSTSLRWPTATARSGWTARWSTGATPRSTC